MLNAYRGVPNDRPPVAPEFWYYYPNKLLGVLPAYECLALDGDPAHTDVTGRMCAWEEVGEAESIRKATATYKNWIRPILRNWSMAATSSARGPSAPPAVCSLSSILCVSPDGCDDRG